MTKPYPITNVLPPKRLLHPPKEMFNIYRKISAGPDPDPGFVSLLGFYMTSQRARATPAPVTFTGMPGHDARIRATFAGIRRQS